MECFDTECVQKLSKHNNFSDFMVTIQHGNFTCQTPFEIRAMDLGLLQTSFKWSNIPPSVRDRRSIGYWKNLPYHVSHPSCLYGIREWLAFTSWNDEGNRQRATGATPNPYRRLSTGFKLTLPRKLALDPREYIDTFLK